MPVASIEVDEGRWTIEYPFGGKMLVSTNIVRKSINVPERPMLATLGLLG